MGVVYGLTLAALLSLSGSFHDGLQQLHDKQYDAAIASLTEVVKVDAPDNVLRHLALYYRAQAYQAKGDPKTALADLVLLLQQDIDPSLDKDARALYLKLGGTDDALLPKRPPPDVWQLFCTAIRGGKLDEALQYCSQSFRDLYAIDQQRYTQLWTNFVNQDIGEYTALGWRIGRREGQITSLLVVENPRAQLYRVDFVRRGADWLIGNLEVMQPATDPDINWARLVKLGRLLALYADQGEGKLPDTLEGLVTAGIARRAELMWQPFGGTKPAQFWYRGGLKHDPKSLTIVASAPDVVDAHRLSLLVDGTVHNLPEEDFRAQVQAQGWAPPGLLKPEELSADQKALIQKYIKQLAAESFDDRDEARRQLTELGTTARPYLDQHRDDPDPEVRHAIRQLLHVDTPKPKQPRAAGRRELQW